MIRRLEVLDRRHGPRRRGVLDRAAVPLLPALPRDPRHRRLVRPRPARPDRPGGRLRRQPAPRPRRRPAAGHLHAAQRQPAAQALAGGPQPDDAARRPARAGPSPSPGRSERSWLIRVPLTRRGHFRIEPLHIRTGDPFGFFEAAATVGQGVSVVVYPRLEPIPAWRLPSASPRGQPRLAGADAPDDPARDDGPAVRAGRQHEPHPLADRPPGTARSRSRSSTSSRPPTPGSSSTSSAASAAGAATSPRPRPRPRGGGHRRQGDRREPRGRDDRQRRRGPRSCRPTAAAASTRRSCSSWPRSRPTGARRSSRRSSRRSAGCAAG